MHLTSCGTLVILITSIGEFLLYYCQFFFISFHCKKKCCCRTVFLCCLWLSYFYCRIACSSGLNCDQMEPPHEEQYSEYSVERNHRAYMSMTDYINLPWQNLQPVERNPNPWSMRDYRNPPCAPSYMVPPIHAPYGNAFNPS